MSAKMVIYLTPLWISSRAFFLTSSSVSLFKAPNWSSSPYKPHAEYGGSSLLSGRSENLGRLLVPDISRSEKTTVMLRYYETAVRVKAIPGATLIMLHHFFGVDAQIEVKIERVLLSDYQFIWQLARSL